MIEVIITDDHPLIREGVKKTLHNEIDIEVVAEARNAAKTLSLLQNKQPDLLILDITMPGKSGLEFLKDIRKLFPELRILILSIHPAKRFAVRALKAGAHGYLCKSSISEELVKAIRKITRQKRKYITPDAAELLAGQFGENNGELHEALSDREFEVLRMIAQGMAISKIADELNLSSHTIHTYRSRIKEKMHLESNVEMTRYAINNELID
ncbi:MAG TPA: response regulator transcription factor [Fodinibius sp.]|nr:response regulator transcription factor [Fodinibius sp.]